MAVAAKAAAPAPEIQQAPTEPDYGTPETLSAADVSAGDSGMTGIDIRAALEAAGVEAGDGESETPPEEDAGSEGEADGDEEEAPAETEGDEALGAAAKQLMQQFLDSDAGSADAMKTLFEAASPKAQAAFLKSLGGTAEAGAETGAPENEDWLSLGPVYKDLKSLPDFKKGVQQTFGTHVDHIIQANVGVAVLEATLEALAAAQGVTLPKRDYEAYKKAAKAGKGYSDAIKSYTNALTKVKAKVSQANKDRPAGVASGAGDRIVVPTGGGLMDFIKAAREANIGG